MKFPDSLVTLPRDHPSLLNVTDDESVVRRFNPDSDVHRDLVSQDEGASKRIQLKAGALDFSEDGCSVGRPEVLKLAHVRLTDMLLPKYRMLAEADVSAIREFEHPDSVNVVRKPFEIVADAYPIDEPSPQQWQVGHALLTLADGYGRIAKRTAKAALAMSLFNPIHVTAEAGG